MTKITNTETKTETKTSINDIEKDIQLLGNVLQQHDQSIFQMIASLNAIQSILIEKDLCTEKDLINKTKAEADILQKKIIDMVNKDPEDSNEEEIKG